MVNDTNNNNNNDDENDKSMSQLRNDQILSHNFITGKIKHSKQIQEMENLPRQTAKVPSDEDNSGSDSSSSSSSEEIQEGKDHRTADQIKNMEPLDELKAEVLCILMLRY